MSDDVSTNDPDTAPLRLPKIKPAEPYDRESSTGAEPPSGRQGPGEPTRPLPLTEAPPAPAAPTAAVDIPRTPLHSGPRPRPARVPRAQTPSVLHPGQRVRRVTRVVRHIDTWSVFKVGLVFSLFLYAVCLTSGVMLWQVAQNTGTVDNVERFFESFGWQTFQLKGGAIFHSAWTGGLFLVIGLTGLFVLGATLFNLITDLVGGVRVTVLEEEVVTLDDVDDTSPV